MLYYSSLLIINRKLIVQKIVLAIFIVLLLIINLFRWRHVALIASLGHFHCISNVIEFDERNKWRTLAQLVVFIFR